MKKLYNYLKHSYKKEFSDFNKCTAPVKLFLIILFVIVIIINTFPYYLSFYNKISIDIVLIYLAPLFGLLIPELRKKKRINDFYKDLKEKNENIDLFYFVGLFFILCLSLIWGTNIIDDTRGKFLASLQSITASIAPLAMGIAYKNYARKSSVKFILKIKAGISHVYPNYIKEILFLNEKDRSNIILNMYIIFDDKYITKLEHDVNQSIIKAYDMHIFSFLPFTSYNYFDIALVKCIDMTDTSIEELFRLKNKRLVIECTQGWYQSNEFIGFNKFDDDNILVNQKISKHDISIRFEGRREIEKIKKSTGENIQLILPKDFETLIVLEDDINSELWIYIYTDKNNEAKVFKGKLNKEWNLFFIDFEIFKMPVYPQYSILDKINYENRIDKKSFDEYINNLSDKTKIQTAKVHFITPDISSKP